MISIRRELFRKVTIIGVGLIGGSLGMALKKHRLAREVVGVSQKQASLTAALKMNAIDQAYHEPARAVPNSDLVVLATPVSIITNMLTTIGPHLNRNCIITDVGSTKSTIVNFAQDHLPNSVFFVGSHPLTGSEKTGVQFGSADLFQGALCLMTPGEKTNRPACDRIKRLWSVIGMQVKYMSPEEHDKMLAYVSHVPHVLAYALMQAIPSSSLEYAAQGLRDTTRIAASSPQMWTDICLNNQKNIIQGLDDLAKNLSQLRKSINTGDQKTLFNYFKDAKAKRDNLDGIKEKDEPS